MSENMSIIPLNQVSYCTIQAEEDGQRLDNYLLRILKGVPKSHIYRVIRSGEVRVNMKRAQPATRLNVADVVRIPPMRHTAHEPAVLHSRLASCLSECVIYEDASLLVINKPSGIAVHGGSGVSLGVIEALRQLRTDISYLELVHRLDRETSGCLLMAKKRSMLRAIQAQLESRAIKKSYWTLLSNQWHGKASVTVDAALEKNILKSGERMVKVAEFGKAAQTRFKLIENYPTACWVEAQPRTGRTHQIRVHSAYIQHPIIGDLKYGSKANDILPDMPQRLYLHAREIEFTLNGEVFQFKADLDNVFEQAIGMLRHEKIV